MTLNDDTYSIAVTKNGSSFSLLNSGLTPTHLPPQVTQSLGKQALNYWPGIMGRILQASF